MLEYVVYNRLLNYLHDLNETPFFTPQSIWFPANSLTIASNITASVHIHEVLEVKKYTEIS